MHNHLRPARVVFAVAVVASLVTTRASGESPVQVSGIYPHLASYNGHGECGIGAVVPWAGRLWWLTYPPHEPRGSRDKLYSIGEDFKLTIHEESVGGTHAGRMIHRESQQLIMGPYFMDKDGKVRVADVKNELVGRLTGVARHLSDPANKVYIYDMEGMLYEVDVHSLETKRLFKKPVPGWHGKGAYTGQGRLVISNNGEHPAGPQNEAELLAGSFKRATADDAGVLAEWDGKDWRIVERRQFTDITGPGGIAGAKNDSDPVWAIGWDKRSVILKLLDGRTDFQSVRPENGEGKIDGRIGNPSYQTFRLPKASYSFDPQHGWFTEWPRIRQVTDDRWLMVMHGAMYDFPPTFSSHNTRGIRPIAQHLRYIPDFCQWGDKLVLASDDTSIMQNKLAGQSQSNLWFGTFDKLREFGSPLGFGGVWLGDAVKAGAPSDPFLVAGYQHRCLHLSSATDAEVTFTLQFDADGSGAWQDYKQVAVPARGYKYEILPRDLTAEWVRIVADKDCQASAYWQLRSSDHHQKSDAELFAGIITPADLKVVDRAYGLLRPAARDRDLHFFALSRTADGRLVSLFVKVDETLKFKPNDETESQNEVEKLCAIEKVFDVDDASAFIRDGSKRLRLPKGHAIFDSPPVPLRAERECVSERSLANIHGTFYEVPRGEGTGKEELNWYKLKPIATHNRLISDYCTWRGLFVIAGVQAGAKPTANFFPATGRKISTGLWFGSIDDLWKFGKPVGVGGPWKQTVVAAGVPSDPYLMTGYDRKRLVLSHVADAPMKFRIEVDVDNRGYWRPYAELSVPSGGTLEHMFDDGFGAHWVRLVADRACTATATFYYE